MPYDDDLQNPVSTPTATEAVLQVVTRHPEMAAPLLKVNDDLKKADSEISAVTPHKHDGGFDVDIQENKNAPQVVYGTPDERSDNFRAALAQAEKAVEGVKGMVQGKGIDCDIEHARSGLGGPLQAKLSCDITR